MPHSEGCLGHWGLSINVFDDNKDNCKPYMCVGLWVHKPRFLGDEFGFSQEAWRKAKYGSKSWGPLGCVLGCVYMISSQWPGRSMAGRQTSCFRWTSTNGKAWCFLGSNIHGHMVGPDISVLRPGLLVSVSCLCCPPHTLAAVTCVPGDSLERKRECSQLSGLKTGAGNLRRGKIWMKSFLGLRLRTEYQKSHLWIARARCWAAKTGPAFPWPHAIQHPGNTSLGYHRPMIPALRRLRIRCQHQPRLQREDFIENK